MRRVIDEFIKSRDQTKHVYPPLVVEEVRGNLVYFTSIPIPHKGNPTIERVTAANTAKRFMKQFDKEWVRKSMAALSPHLLLEKHLCPTAREIVRVGTKLGFPVEATVVAHILEFDAAYRFRLQDVLSESSQEALFASPLKETRRLVALYLKRDNYAQRAKFRFMKLLPFVLLWPPYRRLFKTAVHEANFRNLQFDSNDVWWAMRKTDYAYLGLPYEMRVKLAVETFG